MTKKDFIEHCDRVMADPRTCVRIAKRMRRLTKKVVRRAKPKQQ